MRLVVIVNMKREMLSNGPKECIFLIPGRAATAVIADVGDFGVTVTGYLSKRLPNCKCHKTFICRMHIIKSTR